MQAPLARAALIVLAALLLGFALGLHPVAEFNDMACPTGTVVRYVGVAYWAVTCEASDPSAPATSVPTSRYIGLFLTTVNVRVFDMDFIADNFHGPARFVSPGR
jgi:hypothetical protein